MSIPDTIMREWFELLTDRPCGEIETLLDARQTHPKEAKKALGRDIVAFYHGQEGAAAAQAEWERQKENRQDPTNIPQVDLPAGTLVEGKLSACKLLVALGLAPSNNEARRLVQGGGVTVGEAAEKIGDPNAALLVQSGLIVRVGSRRVVRVRLV
jgi:tyrosyl-tRNA synthetase